MYRFTNILFSPLGDKANSEAQRRVAGLATKNRAKVTLFGVIDEPSRFQRLRHSAEHLQAVQEAETKQMSIKLARCSAFTEGLDVETTIRAGRPADSIIEQVATGGQDLVVVTTDEDAQDHSTIKRLLRECPCPVWVIRPSRAKTQRVLAAVNPDADELELNRSILEIASSMVRMHGGELHLISAWQLYGESSMRSSIFMNVPKEEIQLLLETEAANQHAALRDLCRATGLQAEPWQMHVEKGYPAHVITQYVDKHRINLLVIGTVARTGVPAFVIGNTAETVLDEVRCSVIATKPPGFGITDR